MHAADLRQEYLVFFAALGHSKIARSNLVPREDPTTLFTGSGMQPLIPYFLGSPHPQGSRLVDSQLRDPAETGHAIRTNPDTEYG